MHFPAMACKNIAIDTRHNVQGPRGGGVLVPRDSWVQDPEAQVTQTTLDCATKHLIPVLFQSSGLILLKIG